MLSFKMYAVLNVFTACKICYTIKLFKKKEGKEKKTNLWTGLKCAF